MTEKKPIVLKNVRLSCPSIRRPSEASSPRGPSVTITIPTKYSPLAHAYLWSALMGGMIPATRAIVRHDPQKLLPPPGPCNRPMSVWDPETFLVGIGDLLGATYEQMAADYKRGFEAMMPKPAKPRRYYIAGGHSDMQPPGTFDLDDEYIEFDKGSPTGRRLAPFVMPLDRTVRRHEHQHKIAIINLGTDYAALEARVLATLADKRVRGVLIDIESGGGEIAGNSQMALYRQAFMQPKEEAAPKKAPPAYLKHDPTKRHKRRRR